MYKKNFAKKSFRFFYYLVAIGFGSGLSPVIPGTIGSLCAIPLWWLMTFLSLKIYYLIIFLSICIGIYLCHHTTNDIGIHDHPSIVWDEFIGMWITLIGVPSITWQWILIGFVIFRIFDFWKPWPIYWFDRNVHGGMGVIIDDIVAGTVSAIILHGLAYYSMDNNIII
ncbi:phosphatidylglycerophosphatase A [Candidatus Pantoea carbekii]|uniref:Phosphatidylglycerophosphatase A n=1 Tax=Candidatus Pantoea carbekii TaxID=1235990 RepID=U3U8P8_9GAMM|nr:phosphatidylglycerophosphatase A [Candidatus Pantoea carbekii]